MKNTLYIRLMTIFTAIIGLNAAFLVCYILAYSQFVGEFPRTNDSSANRTMAQANDSLNISAMSPANASPTPLSPLVTYENITDIATPSSYVEVDYNPEKQKTFEELQAKKEQEKQEPTSIPEQNVQDNFSQENYTQTTPVLTEHMQDNFSQEYYAQAIPAPTQNVQETVNQNSNNNSSGNADNFYTYYNPHLQQTTASFVLNISSLVFHLPECNDVAKMAEKNYVESYATFNEIISQGYRPCGHCLKDYPNISYSSSSDNIYNSNIDNNTSLQQTEDTYIINTESGYFHLPDGCKYAIKYSPEEVCIISNNSFDELKSQGYLPCRHCFG
ncbi:MAG: hypothetical protein NC400_03610 [Clostridium sp.]|nr:hypothetical protein [Clostridium sp.]